MKQPLFKEQGIPLVLTVLTFLGICLMLFAAISLLSLFPAQEKIHILLRPQDILIGLTIYLKTAVDFAIFIGNLMRSNPGWKNRIAIEIGTALGNMAGTIAILAIWNFFREVPLLMAIMIILASFVLLRMAEESIEELLATDSTVTRLLGQQITFLSRLLRLPNKATAPLLQFISFGSSFTNAKKMTFKQLALFSMTVPFILGLDDFAGYIPLFSIVNVFGFGVGVFLGHMLLNAALFVSPQKTSVIVRLPIILLLGGGAFILIALWGLYEAGHLLVSVAF